MIRLANPVGQARSLGCRKRFRLAWLLAFGLVAPNGIHATAQTSVAHKPAITSADLQGLREGLLPQSLSPDGRYLALSPVTDGDPATTPLWIIDVNRPSKVQVVGIGIFPKWSPDGSRLAYYSKESGTWQLWLYELETRSRRKASEIAGGIDPDPRAASWGPVLGALAYAWSPDGQKIAFTSRSGSAPSTPSTFDGASSPNVAIVVDEKSAPSDSYAGVFSSAFPEHRLWAFWETAGYSVRTDASAVNRIYVLDLASGASEARTADDLSYLGPSWSPDGATILAVRTNLTQVRGRSFPSEIVSIDHSGAATVLARVEENGAWSPVWSPDGSKYFYFAALRNGARTLRIGTRRGEMVDVGEVIDRSVFGAAWTGKGHLFVQYRDGVDDPIERIDLGTMTRERVDDGTAAARYALSTSRNGTVVWAQNDPIDPLRIFFKAPNRDRPRVLRSFNPQVKTWAAPNQKVVRWRNSRGERLEGILMLPPGHRAGEPLPLVVDLYPDTKNDFKRSPMFANRALAEKGYAVFYLPSRAPHSWRNPFKSVQFDSAGKGSAGWEVGFDDVMSGVEMLVAAGVADERRMCLYGFSNGGSIVASIVSRTDRFACAISASGAMLDWVRPSLLTRSYELNLLLGGPEIWEAADEYVKVSPVFERRKVSTPLLLMAGDQEGDFLLDMIEFYQKVRAQGGTVTLVRYPGQGHGLSGAALADFERKRENFLDRYLSATAAR